MFFNEKYIDDANKKHAIKLKFQVRKEVLCTQETILASMRVLINIQIGGVDNSACQVDSILLCKT